MIKSEGEKPMFCYNCGQQLSEDNYCSRCNITVPPLNQELAMKSIQNLSATQSNTNLSAKPLPEETPQSLFEKGKRCEVNGNFFGAIKYYREGVEAGSIEAAEALLEVYTSGKYNVHPNNKELVDLLEKLVSVNSPIALFKLAIINLKSPHIVGLNAPDYKTATSLLERAAILNDSMAAFVLGEIYFYGSQFSQYTKGLKTFINNDQIADYEKAQYWYKIASDNGIGAASNMLGVPLQNRGKFQDAAFHFEKGANQGSSAAMANLGISHIKFQPYGYSQEQAISWLNKAAEQGFTEAMIALAVLYSNGKDCQPDISYKWVCAASNLGNERASKLKSAMEVKTLEKMRYVNLEGLGVVDDLGYFNDINYPPFRDIW